MTRKDFEMIAATLKASRMDGEEASAQWCTACHAFAEMCSRTNPRFNRSRFLKACGMEE